MTRIAERLAFLLAAMGVAIGAAGAEPPGTLLFGPHRYAADDPRLGKGCWMTLYDHNDFNGKQVTIVGPTAIPDLNAAIRWLPRSVVVGPKAQVTAFDTAGFQNEAPRLLAGQRMAAMPDQFGLFKGIGSFRILCTS